MLKRILLVAILSSFVFASTLWAAVPALMNYQGILTNASGNPLISTSRSVQFTIYDAAVAGAVQWAETLTVNTDASGRFNTILGKVHPLTDAVFSGTDRFLGLTIASDPELSPRTQIVSVGYANRVSTVDGATGGTITGDVTLNSTLTADNVVAGDATTAGTIRMTNGNGTNGMDALGTVSGGSVYLYDEAGNYTHWIYPYGGPGEGSMILLGEPTLSYGIGLHGDPFGTDNPLVLLFGVSNSTVFDMSATGDATVSLPGSAVSSPEILDEPGVAANNNGSIIALGATMIDLLTVTITIPAPGYVVVNGKCYVRTGGAATFNYAYVQIDQTAGGGAVFPYYALAGSSGLPNASDYFWPMYVTRTYYFGVAGTYTFRMEGETVNGGGGASAASWDHIMTATYYPTAYGGVVTAVAADQAGQFEQATPVPSRETPGMTKVASTEQMYQVDLRELELKVAKTRAEAEKAQRELLQAQMKLQKDKIQALHPKQQQKQ